MLEQIRENLYVKKFVSVLSLIFSKSVCPVLIKFADGPQRAKIFKSGPINSLCVHILATYGER